ENSRLATALITVQKEIPFYFGQIVNEVFTVEKQVLAKMPEAVQEDMQNTIAGLYSDEPRKYGPVIELESITDREMTTAGWVMHFDNEKLKEEDLDLSLLKNEIMSTVFDKFIRSGNKGRIT